MLLHGALDDTRHEGVDILLTSAMMTALLQEGLHHVDDHFRNLMREIKHRSLLQFSRTGFSCGIITPHGALLAPS